MGLYDLGSLSSLSSPLIRSLRELSLQICGKVPRSRHAFNSPNIWSGISENVFFEADTSTRSFPGALLFLTVLIAILCRVCRMGLCLGSEVS